ncbi:MAG: hypothetical protein ACK5JM_10130 [Rhodoblastus sp.]
MRMFPGLFGATAVAACLFAAAILTPALAADDVADASSLSENGRYSMTPAADGFLRLDTRTGQVSLCRVENGAAFCHAAAEERTALENEIDRLLKKNQTLQGKSGDPEHADKRAFDRALDYAEQFMRRMMKIMREEEPAKDKT